MLIIWISNNLPSSFRALRTEYFRERRIFPKMSNKQCPVIFFLLIQRKKKSIWQQMRWLKRMRPTAINMRLIPGRDWRIIRVSHPQNLFAGTAAGGLSSSDTIAQRWISIRRPSSRGVKSLWRIFSKAVIARMKFWRNILALCIISLF